MLEEFKKFIMRGNVVDLAVGVIIGVTLGIALSAAGHCSFPPSERRGAGSSLARRHALLSEFLNRCLVL